MNHIQIAYNALEKHQKEFATITNELAVNEHLGKTDKLARAVWLAVAKDTKKVNPSLKKEVDRGVYDCFYLLSSNMCFLDANWQVRAKGHKCKHCGKIHNPEN